jgi:GT2 family glycosyltransferase
MPKAHGEYNILNNPVKISVVIPAYKRTAVLLNSLERILDCDPQPAEILVHVDGGQRPTEYAVKQAFPDMVVLISNGNIGPGGGRNKLLKAAGYPIVVSFDDDSFPLKKDFFVQVERVFEDYPAASIVACDICEKKEGAPAFHAEHPMWVADFVGCGCIYKRDDFLKLQGYIPLPNAYGCEEADLSLQLFAAGMQILYHPDLKVYHNTEMEHHASSAVNKASIQNQALLAFLRYPVVCWPLGGMQVLNRVLYLIKMKRTAGIWSGLTGSIPHCMAFRRFRHPVRAKTARYLLRIRQTPLSVSARQDS